ncbi:MAG: FMN-binding protein [Gammaproteobacteria bacterium]
MFNPKLKVLFLAFFCLMISTAPSRAKIFYSKNEAMELAFGKDATVEMMSLFPDESEIAEIEKLSRVKMESALFTFYVGKKDGRILGYAAIETHTVRTKPETLLVVLDPEGELRDVRTLAFHEPPEYQPPQRWFKQMYHRDLSELSFNADIQGITGATLSTRAALNSARKVLAVFQIAVKDKKR